MSDAQRISDAVLFEGYLLYPYRSAALKNRHRWSIGTLYPPAFCRAFDAGDASSLRMECLVRGSQTKIRIRLRFLQIDEVREVHLEELGETTFRFDPIEGALSASASSIAPGVLRLSVAAENKSDFQPSDRDDAMIASMASPHLIASIEGGSFVSTIDPPEDLRELSRSCRSENTWPVLAGAELLSAPIILPDHPQIAPESFGDFFDGTEIDELLSLRLLTLTPEEKRAISDPRARRMLDRTEALGVAALAQLHGRRVVLHPKGRADVFDLALEGKTATIESIERDVEGRTFVAVTVDDDPGKDLGAFGHRFFFRPDEVEPA